MTNKELIKLIDDHCEWKFIKKENNETFDGEQYVNKSFCFKKENINFNKSVTKYETGGTMTHYTVCVN